MEYDLRNANEKRIELESKLELEMKEWSEKELKIRSDFTTKDEELRVVKTKLSDMKSEIKTLHQQRTLVKVSVLVLVLLLLLILISTLLLLLLPPLPPLLLLPPLPPPSPPLLLQLQLLLLLGFYYIMARSIRR